jgi:hypothetical protein
MSQAEREKAVADAIILERAARVLRSRFPGLWLTDPAMHAAVAINRRFAVQLRSEAERD